MCEQSHQHGKRQQTSWLDLVSFCPLFSQPFANLNCVTVKCHCNCRFNLISRKKRQRGRERESWCLGLCFFVCYRTVWSQLHWKTAQANEYIEKRGGTEINKTRKKKIQAKFQITTSTMCRWVTSTHTSMHGSCSQLFSTHVARSYYTFTMQSNRLKRITRFNWFRLFCLDHVGTFKCKHNERTTIDHPKKKQMERITHTHHNHGYMTHSEWSKMEKWIIKKPPDSTNSTDEIEYNNHHYAMTRSEWDECEA